MRKRLRLRSRCFVVADRTHLLAQIVASGGSLVIRAGLEPTEPRPSRPETRTIAGQQAQETQPDVRRLAHVDPGIGVPHGVHAAASRNLGLDRIGVEWDLARGPRHTPPHYFWTVLDRQAPRKLRRSIRAIRSSGLSASDRVRPTRL